MADVKAEKEGSSMDFATGFDVSSRDPDLDSYDNFRNTISTPNGNSSTFLPRDPPLAPPTPPMSYYEKGIILDDPLGYGGIPWIFRDFQVEGTTCLFLKDTFSNISRPSELGDTSMDLHKNDEDILEIETIAMATPSKEKSMRSRKKTQTKNK